jgi:hypothetical protein
VDKKKISVFNLTTLPWPSAAPFGLPAHRYFTGALPSGADPFPPSPKGKEGRGWGMGG